MSNRRKTGQTKPKSVGDFWINGLKKMRIGLSIITIGEVPPSLKSVLEPSSTNMDQSFGLLAIPIRRLLPTLETLTRKLNRTQFLLLEVSDNSPSIVLRVQDLICHRIENKWDYAVSFPVPASCTDDNTHKFPVDTKE